MPGHRACNVTLTCRVDIRANTAKGRELQASFVRDRAFRRLPPLVWRRSVVVACVGRCYVFESAVPSIAKLGRRSRRWPTTGCSASGYCRADLYIVPCADQDAQAWCVPPEMQTCLFMLLLHICTARKTRSEDLTSPTKMSTFESYMCSVPGAIFGCARDGTVFQALLAQQLQQGSKLRPVRWEGKRSHAPIHIFVLLSVLIIRNTALTCAYCTRALHGSCDSFLTRVPHNSMQRLNVTPQVHTNVY